MKFQIAAALLSLMLLPGAATAESVFKGKSAAEREKLIRETMFAVDNPERVFAIESPAPQPSLAQPLSVDPVPSVVNPADRRYTPRGSQQRATDYRQNRYQQSYQEAPQDQSVVGVDQNGRVRVQSGNKALDRSVETYIDRKVRNAKGAIQSYFR